MDHAAVSSAIKSIINPGRRRCISSVVVYDGCVVIITVPGGLLVL